MELNFSVDPGTLTKTEQKIFGYMVTHTDSFLFLPIGQIAQELQVSDATLSRFARHVGCKDFKDLKASVMEQAAKSPAVKLAGTLGKEDRFSPEKWLEQQMLYLKKTAEQMETPAFYEGAKAIASAKRIFLHGKNASASLAQLLYYRLRRLGLTVILLPSAGSELLEGLAQTEKDDLVLFFAFSKLSGESRILLEQSKETGYQTMAFTSRVCTPKAESADIQIFVYRGEEREYHSSAAPAAMVDGLVLAVTEQLGVKGMESLSKLQKLKKKYKTAGM